MSTMRKLTMLNLNRNRTRTAVTIVGIMLSAALVTVVTGIVTSGRQSLVETEVNICGDWSVAVKGDFDANTAESLAQNRDVEHVYEKTPVGTAKFLFKSEYKAYVNLSGLSENTYENCYRCELEEGHYPQSSDEILLTPQFVSFAPQTYHVGDTITLDVGGRWEKGTVTKQSIPAFESEGWEEHSRETNPLYDPDKEDFIPEFTKTYTVAGILKTAKGYLESDSSSTEIRLFTGRTYDKSERSAAYEHASSMMLRLYDSKERDYIQTLSDLTGMTTEQTREWLSPHYNPADGVNASERSIPENRFGITDIQYNDSVLRMRIFNVSERTMSILIGIAAIVTAIIVLSSIFIIRNSFAISITEKTRLYGMLSSVGATPRQVLRNVMFEGFLLGVIGISLGVVLGIGVTTLLITISNSLLSEGLNGIRIVFSVSWIGIAVAVVVSALTIFFSMFFTAVGASRIAPIDAIRGKRDIRSDLEKSYHKTPKWIDKLFGIGGSIAYKNLKRSRKKYRATVVSIVASVAMFLAVSTLVTATFSYMALYLQQVNYNVEIVPISYEFSYRDADDWYDSFKRMDTVESVVSTRSVVYGVHMRIDKSNLTEEVQNPDVHSFFYGIQEDQNEKSKMIVRLPRLVALDDDSYREVCSVCGVDYAYAKDKGLINNENTEITDNKLRANGEILKKVKDADLELFFGEENDLSPAANSKKVTLNLAGELVHQEAIHKRVHMKGLDSGAVIVTLDWMKEHVPQDAFVKSAFYIQSSNPDKTEQELSEMIGGAAYISNYDRTERTVNAFTLVVQIFVYGFILVITLIGITNIFNTISTNMRLRASEFASLRSIGMTRREFNRMIRLESVFYSAKSLLIGIPIGLLAGWGIQMVYSMTEEIPYQFPWLAVLISIVAVGLVVWIIMRYSIVKVSKQNIIETIRNENI
ncbi:MAG: ABC transporter permease [Ruminococcus sp.]|nr:ABC transporter permease [Ruminococcus sp.]